MNVIEEQTHSLWMEGITFPAAPVIDANQSCDVVVIGSGIAGLSTAYELVRGGRTVVVIDRGALAGGMTARTSAHLSPLCDDGQREMISRNGLDFARTFYHSQAAAIDRIEAIIRAENLQCDFSRLKGYLFRAPETDQSALQDQLAASHEMGIEAQFATSISLRGVEPADAICYPQQARLHPLRYLSGLSRILEQRGVKFFGNSPVLHVDETPTGVTASTAQGFAITAQHAVVATNSPINNIVALHSKLAPYRTYVIGLAVPTDAIEDALYWDTADPYHYIRLHQGESQSTLIVGGEDHKSGEANDGEQRFRTLENWIRSYVPEAGNVTHRWSGQVLETLDYAAYSGLNLGNNRIYIHTGDSGQGLTHGVTGALTISSLILRGEPAWSNIYDPSRTSLRSLGQYVSENLTAAKNIAGYVTPGEIGSPDELMPGQGAIMRQGTQKLAVYRNEQDAVTLKSAICTHLGCLVSWNSTEKCWDCACHGSQFSPTGAVLNGPAITPLADV